MGYARYRGTTGYIGDGRYGVQRGYMGFQQPKGYTGVG